MDLARLAEAIDELAAAGPEACSDAATIELLQRQVARLDGYLTAAVAQFDASGAWGADGARSAAAWLAAYCGLANSQARRQVRRGRTMRQLPALAEAWMAGDVTAAHVDALSAVRTCATEQALERDQELLVEQASTLPFGTFRRSLSYWHALADPDGVEEDAESVRTRRDVYLRPSFEGIWLGQMTLDPVSGAIVADELERIERELFEQDWAETRSRLGGDPLAIDLGRTAAQRRADALVEMATRSRTAPANGRRPVPLFSVLVDYETLHGRICELAQGMAVTPGSLVPWLDQAVVERAVFGPDRRVEVGSTTRLFRGATRRAIELRDQRCTHPCCDRPIEQCEVDHVVPYSAGGPTTQENGRLLCGFHNRLRNQRPPPPS
ncbi:MAG: DUF222 domain-containing protein [Actinomycetota bacterium]|nr:DUF222 domain-containing protein [Actinomycetota bacterium]MDA8280535.1 DUF222 domain-containing protein [Actinomycetota bacterium]